MYTKIYQNSYVIFIFTFIILCIIFYVLEIGYVTHITPNGKINKKFSWKYPLAISLIVWLIWHFYLYPPPSNNGSIKQEIQRPQIKPVKINSQEIDMANWN